MKAVPKNSKRAYKNQRNLARIIHEDIDKSREREG
jgi:hypothetical protein